ncbi:MAG: chromate transporter [Candidatus Cloacimonetes bacterium]|nr:chromate transporter [Candidatus Cloacimonadota bacterium]
MIYLELFLISLKIGLFSFGGGYAMLPLIRTEVVGRGWLSAPEFIDMVAVSQITPGPIAINACTFVGYKMGGIAGALSASLGMILPPFIFMSVVAVLWMKFAEADVVQKVFLFLRPATIGLIGSAAVLLAGNSLVNAQSILLFTLALGFLLKFKLNPIWLIVAGGLIGFIFKL